MKKFNYILLFFAFTYLKIVAQQLPVNNQYLINPFSISPAYAGVNGSVESFLSYRQNWLGISGAPKTEIININGAIGEKYGVGANLTSDQTGIFNTFSLLTTFAYHLKITPNKTISFGMHSGVFRNKIDFTTGDVQDLSDPFFANAQTLSAWNFETGAGILFRCHKLNIGYSIPRLLENKLMNSNNDVLYTSKMHSVIHLFYTFGLNRNIELSPFFIARTTQGSMTFDASVLVKYMGKLWVAPAYRKDGTLNLSIGGAIYDKLVMNYSYEFSGKGIQGKSSGTHEISLGFLIGKQKADIHSSSIFRKTSSQPYYDWIKE